MLFAGNTANNAAQANSVYLAADGGNSALIAFTDTGAVIDLRDPLGGTAANNGSISLTKDGPGSLYLAGANVFTVDPGGPGASFSVNAGRLHLYRNGEVSSGGLPAGAAGLNLGIGSNSAFSLASGANLSLGGNNSIIARSVSLAGGSSLSFDPAGLGANSALTIGAQSQTLSSGANLNFGIDLRSWLNGTHVLIDSQTAGKFSGLDLAAAEAGLTLNGQSLSSVQYSRASASLGTANNGSQLVLQATTSNNLVLFWTGATDAVWSSGPVNWRDTLSVAQTFLGGDKVIFDNTGSPRTITVTGSAAVAAMEIIGGTYEFSGDAIVSADSSTIISPNYSKDLRVISSWADFRNALDFENGLYLDTGATVNLLDGSSLSQRMTVNNDGILNFAHSEAYTQSGSLTGDGEYHKTGTGLLTVNGTNTASGGFHHERGEVALNSDWAGAYYQNNTAGAFRPADGVNIGGDARFSGAVDIQGPATGGPGTLYVGGTLTLDGATLNVDLFSGNRSDSIDAGGAQSFDSGLNLNTVNLGSWASGIFTLVNSGFSTINLAHFKPVTLNGHALGSRANAALSLPSSDLVLTTSVTNADLTWNRASNLWSYSAADQFWLNNNPAADSFHPLDGVFFTAGQDGAISVDAGGVQVSRLTVNGGEYAFYGGPITGQAVNELNYVRNGKLEISGAGTKARFNNDLDFAAGIEVHSGGLLGGNGSLKGDLRVYSGGIVSPGNSIGRLKVDGNVSFDASSYFDVEVDPADPTHSDRLEATGTASLGGATVRHTGLGSSTADYSPLGQWIILSADGGLNGTFNPTVQSDFQFLNAELLYQGNNVLLQLSRNTGPGGRFSDFAITRNQRAVAGSLDTLSGGPLYNALMKLPVGSDFAGLYDQLSGEIHASLLGSLQHNDRAFGRALRGRLLVDENLEPGWPLWVTIDGNVAHTDSTGNTAKAKYESWGVTLGAERRMNENFLLGAAFRYADGELMVNGRDSSIDVDSFLFGLYAAMDSLRTENSRLRLTLGGSFGLHQAESSRRVSGLIPSQTLEADYDSRSLHFFSELAYKLKLSDTFSLEPYAEAAWNQVRSESFREHGGSAALKAEKDNRNNASTQLGLRAAARPRENLELSLDLGWQHIYGGRYPQREFAFEGANSFTINGAPLDRDALSLQAGTDWQITPALSLNVGYEGLMGNDYRSHGGALTLKYKF